jgi:ketosteroid isomerase-like protein
VRPNAWLSPPGPIRDTLRRMKHLWVGLVAACLWAVPHAAAQTTTSKADTAKSDPVQELIQLERDWDAAFLRNDVAFVDRVLAAEFIGTYSDGARGDRKQELENVRSFNQQIDSSRLDEFTVQVHGDTAVVWFRRRLIGPSKGQTLTVTHRYLDVFVKRDGRWQCVATQSVRLPNETAPEAR